MIKAFLFDYDGVITAGVKDGVLATRLAHNLGVTYEEANQWIASIWRGFMTGELKEDAVWQRIEEQYGKPITPEQRDIWYAWDELTPLPAMIGLVKHLKSKGFPVGIVSNVLPVTEQVIRENGGYDEFDFVVLSCQVGASKPDAKVFETALAHFNDVAATDVVYLDDREECTDAAGRLGMTTIHVTDHNEAISDVLSLVN